MKAFLISPEIKKIEEIEIAGEQDIIRLIGFDTLESDSIGSSGDHLYFDEECFLRGTTGRFQVDKLIPVSGSGVLVGTSDDGSLQDVATDIDGLRSRIKYL